MTGGDEDANLAGYREVINKGRRTLAEASARIDLLLYSQGYAAAVSSLARQIAHIKDSHSDDALHAIEAVEKQMREHASALLGSLVNE
jgi:hypothetical protein